MVKTAIFLLASAALFAGTVPRTPINLASPADQPPLDMVISGGRVMDPESGLDAVRNVGVRAGKIVEISERPLHGKQIIDAHGLVNAPGFIEVHGHVQEPRNSVCQAT